LRAEDEEERTQALVLNNKVQRAFAEQRVLQQLQAQPQQPQQVGPTEEAQLAKQRVAEVYPDFNEYTEQMDRLVTEDGLLPEDTRTFLADLARTGFEGKMRAWDYLYVAAKAIGAPSRRKAQEVERKRRKTSSDRAKVAAMVSRAEGAPTRTPLNEAEERELNYRNQLRERWNLPLVEEG
jgi:hypothetical protein